MQSPSERTNGDGLAPSGGGGVYTLFPQAYERLRGLALQFIRAEQSKRSLQATALVHDAFVRLSKSERKFTSEPESLAIAATQMRQVLVDYARRALAVKRGNGREPITLDSRILGAPTRAPLELIDVDDSLNRLTQLDAGQGRLAEFHLFGALTIEEAAMLLDISPRTVFNEWRAARAWLLKELAP